MRSQNTIIQRESHARKIHKELNKLYQAKFNLALIPLDKPVRHGWFKYLVLREDVARRKDAAVFQEILDVCGRCVWGRDKPKADEEWERYQKADRDWQWAGLAWITKKMINRLSPKAKQYFVEYEWKWTPWEGSIKRYYCHVPKYFYVPTYEKAYVTHLQAVDSELESQIAHLENQLLGDDLYVYSRYARNNWPSKWWKQKEARRGRRKARMFLNRYDEVEYDLRIGKPWNKVW